MKTARPGALLAATLCLIAAAMSPPLTAYEWMTGKPIRNRTLDIAWELNPRSCPPGTRDWLNAASDILDFYTLTDFKVRYRQDTENRHAVDGRYVVQCSRVLDYMAMGYSFQSGGVTLIARSNELITDADIILNADRMTFDIVLHEFTHMLGLDHSNEVRSIVCYRETPGECRSRGRLDADDLVGLASLYDVPANCTPYMAEDMTVYFPHIAGRWAELKPVDPTDPTLGYYSSAMGISPDYDWQCNLYYSTGFEEVEADIYHRGEVFEAVFLRAGGLWFVNFPDSERMPVL